MQKMRWLSFGAAIVLSSIAMYAPLQTAAAQCVGYRGDCNQDETVDSSDVLVLLAHLTGALSYTEAYAAQFGDMNGDHILNAVDLTLLKRIVQTGAAPEPLVQSELPPIAASVDANARYCARADVSCQLSGLSADNQAHGCGNSGTCFSSRGSERSCVSDGEYVCIF